MEQADTLHLVYIVFLVIFAAGTIVAVSYDGSDKGECRKGLDGEIMVRQPESKLFVERQFCILIQL